MCSGLPVSFFHTYSMEIDCHGGDSLPERMKSCGTKILPMVVAMEFSVAAGDSSDFRSLRRGHAP